MISTLKRIRAHRRAHHKRQKQPLLLTTPTMTTTDQPSTTTTTDLIIIPDIFLCPISLDLMTDPVILQSGVTYDRSSIDKWLLLDEHNHTTCPVTKRPIISGGLDIVPNHALRRAIQDWCVEHGLDRVPTPRPPITSAEVVITLQEFEALAKAGEEYLDRCSRLLAKLREICAESERNRRCIVQNGGGRVLASVFEAFCCANRGVFVFDDDQAAAGGRSCYYDGSSRYDVIVSFLEEALSALAETMAVIVDDDEARKCLETDSSMRAIVWFMKNGGGGGNGGDTAAAMNAVLVLSMIVSGSSRRSEVVVKRLVEEIEGSVDVLIAMVRRDDDDREKNLPRMKRDALKVLFSIASDEETRRSALRGIGIVSVLIDVLIESKSSKEVVEGALGMLDELFGLEQWREEAYGVSALAVPVLVKKMLRVSDTATAVSVSAVWKLCKAGGSDEDDYGRWCCKMEALQVGAFQKLLLLLQIGCGCETKERASELLKLLNSCKDRIGGGGYECIDSSDFKNLKRSFD